MDEGDAMARHNSIRPEIELTGPGTDNRSTPSADDDATVISNSIA